MVSLMNKSDYMKYCGRHHNFYYDDLSCSLCENSKIKEFDTNEVSLEKKVEKEIKTERKFLPTLSDLIDRASIVSLKEILIPENRQEYSEELKLIFHDIDLILEQDSVKIDADFIRSVMILGIYNRLIWENESQARLGKDDGNNLKLSHSLNGVRNRAKNRIENKAKGRKDIKVDCLASEFTQWEPSWDEKEV